MSAKTSGTKCARVKYELEQWICLNGCSESQPES